MTAEAGETPEEQATILVADDDLETLEILSEYLIRQGFKVVTATNGVEVLHQVVRYTPTAVILDLFMPRLGGLPTLDRLRRLDPGIVIILISGISDALEMVMETGVHVAAALTKPFDLRQLLGTLVQAGVLPPMARPGTPSSDLGADPRRPVRRGILVVDDDPEIRNVLVEYCQRKGFEALGAADGEEALRRVRDVRPHIVLLDIAMPGLSGVETLRRIKGLAEDTCVVIISGIEDVETARRTLAMGAADYLSKPIDFRYLDSVLEMHTLMDGMTSYHDGGM